MEKATHEEYSFFQGVERNFDKAAKYTRFESGILEQIKACNSVYRMKFPVRIGDNIEVIEAYRVQHSITSCHVRAVSVTAWM